MVMVAHGGEVEVHQVAQVQREALVQQVGESSH